MSVRGLSVRGLVIVALAAGLWSCLAPAAAGELDPEIIQRFDQWSLPPPTLTRVVVCHGFACKYRTEIGFDAGDHAALKRIMAKAGTSPDSERKAAAEAVAWYGRRIAPEAGTATAKAHAGPSSTGDSTQIDCIESALNTTSLLLMLEGLGLFHYHRVEPTVSRLRPLKMEVHSTAVLSEIGTGARWAVDSAASDSGKLPDVRPLSEWYSGDY